MNAIAVKLWPNGVPGLVPVNKAEVESKGIYSHVSDPELVVYRTGLQENQTALIICPGGGYSQIAWARHVEAVLEAMAERGIVVVGLKYRTLYGANDVVDDACEDGLQAMRIVRSRAVDWGINPQRIGIDGYSSGSNLSLNVMCRFDDGYQSSDDQLGRVSSRPDFVVLRGLFRARQPMSEFTFGPASPPAFVASAKDDRSVPHSFAVAIVDKMRAAGVSVETLMPDTGGHHAFDFVYGKETGSTFPDVLVAWLRTIGMMG